MLQFARDAMRSPLGWLFACLHAVWFLLAIGQKSPEPALADWLDSVSGSSVTLFAGRSFHYAYESLPLKLLVLADAPASIAMVPATLLFSIAAGGFGLSTFEASYVAAAILFVGASIQWLLVGHLVARRTTRPQASVRGRR